MSKSIKRCFFNALTFDKMLDAQKRASKGKTNKYEVLEFNIDMESNIWNIINELKSGKYKLGKYKKFVIYEPKERIIKCLPYRDRIVQQWYIYEFIKPYIIPRLINSTCACIDNRGTHYAVKLVRKYLWRAKYEYGEYYILKLDIKKYFYNIDRNILFNIMKEYISDKLLLNLTKIFIYDNNDKIGIPIGNYTSQYFANIYLDKLDKYIKYEMGIRFYVRYMDDMVIILRNNDECKMVMDKIRSFINSKLHLELNDKSRYYPGDMGVNFCGYRIYEYFILVRNRCKKIMRNRIRKWNKIGKVNMLSLNSWLSHVKHVNSYRLVNRYIDRIKLVMR